MTDDQTTIRAALQIGRDYIHVALAAHDAKYARGYNMPTEIARAGIEADLASIDAALALLDAEPAPTDEKADLERALQAERFAYDDLAAYTASLPKPTDEMALREALAPLIKAIDEDHLSRKQIRRLLCEML